VRTLALALLLPWPQAPDAPPTSDEAVDEAVTALVCDPTRTHDSLELDVALARLAAAHPERITVEPLAASAEGRVVSVVQLHDRTTGEASSKPGLLVVNGLSTQAGFEPDVLLATLCRLAGSYDEGAVRDVLRHVVVHAVLDADPDGRARALAGREAERTGRAAIVIDRNFPAGWDPWLGGAAAGPYPLMRAEARALARHASEQSNLSVVLVLRPTPTPAPERLGTLTPYGDDNARAGSFCEFGRRDLGGFGFVAETFLLGQVAPEQREDEVELLRSTILSLADRLPRLELALDSAQRLRDELWQVDLAATNVGGLPTMGLERAGVRSSALMLRSEGARVVAAAVRGRDDDTFRVHAGDPHELALANLDGGESVTVRLLVAAPEGSGVAVFLSSERAGQARVDVPLE